MYFVDILENRIYYYAQFSIKFSKVGNKTLDAQTGHVSRRNLLIEYTDIIHNAANFT